MDVLALLKDKAQTVHTITSNQTVEDAICLMAYNEVSALLVMKNDQPAGIFSKGDVFITYLKAKATAFSKIVLENALSPEFMVAESRDSVADAMARMIDAGIRYLLVMEGRKIVGMLTLDDLMMHQIEALGEEINQLKDYIEDLHDAGLD